MWFAYTDEAGNTGRRLNDPAQPIHLILGLLVPESSISDVHEAVRQVAAAHCPAVFANDDFELHGADIFGGQGYFQGLAPQDRINLFDDVLSVVTTLDLRLIVRGVDKPRLAARYADPFHPHDIALMFTIESAEEFARSRAQATGGACRILLVADENKETEAQALRDLASYQQVGTTWGWRTLQIDNVVDTIHFVRSDTNRALQLADCATFITSRRLRIARGAVADPTGQSAQAVIDLYDRLIQPRLNVLNIWEP